MNERVHNFFVKRAIFSLLVAVLALVGWFVWRQVQIAKITNFTKCQAAGYPIQESYPARCTVPSGKSFTQEIRGDNGVACTMEAMLCPDGSAVGRSGPNCDFAACPVEIN